MKRIQLLLVMLTLSISCMAGSYQIIVDYKPLLEASESVTLPVYKGGKEGLMKFLAKNVKCPIEALKKQLTGRVALTATLDNDGTMKDVVVIYASDPCLATEGLKVVLSIPQRNWTKFATKDGVEIPCRYSFTFDFIAPEDGPDVIIRRVF